jgi:hypothetical protein
MQSFTRSIGIQIVLSCCAKKASRENSNRKR